MRAQKNGPAARRYFPVVRPGNPDRAAVENAYTSGMLSLQGGGNDSCIIRLKGINFSLVRGSIEIPHMPQSAKFRCHWADLMRLNMTDSSQKVYKHKTPRKLRGVSISYVAVNQANHQRSIKRELSIWNTLPMVPELVSLVLCAST